MYKKQPTRRSTDAEKIKVSEVAQLLGVGKDKVLDLIDRGELRSWKFGPKTIRVCAVSVNNFLELSEQEPTTNDLRPASSTKDTRL